MDDFGSRFTGRSNLEAPVGIEERSRSPYQSGSISNSRAEPTNKSSTYKSPSPVNRDVTLE